MCVNFLSGVNHGTLNEGAPLLTSNPLVSALGSHTGLRENQRKRSLNPLETSTPKRKRQNTDVPKGKTSFAVDKVKKGIYVMFQPSCH